ncbi:MAG TPA: ferritin family protein [Pseudomonadales bacterium]|nr:ferritin family protein [Pseudomonadales bacterium]
MTSKALKNKIRLAFVAEYFAGGFYLEIAKSFADRPDIAQRLRKTAGDEIRHGGYFNQLHAAEFGKSMPMREQLMQAGKVVGMVNNLIPDWLLKKQKRLDFITKGEAAAVRALEKELKANKTNAYLQLVEKILPDERQHADRYHVA